MIQDSVKITGKVLIETINSKGILVESRQIKNLVVTTGKQYIASRMVGTATSMSNMAVGTGTTAAVVSDTTLGTEISRVALSAGSSTSNVTTYSASFPPGSGTGALTEAAIFNAGTAGSMLCRTVFLVINKAAGDTINITWAITVS